MVCCAKSWVPASIPIQIENVKIRHVAVFTILSSLYVLPKLSKVADGSVGYRI
jgi:hypothetical protein